MGDPGPVRTGGVCARDSISRNCHRGRVVGSSTSGPSALLLERTGFGLSPALIAQSRGYTNAGWVAAQLAPQGIADPDVGRLVTAFPVLNLSTKDFSLQSRAANRGGNWDQM